MEKEERQSNMIFNSYISNQKIAPDLISIILILIIMIIIAIIIKRTTMTIMILVMAIPSISWNVDFCIAEFNHRHRQQIIGFSSSIALFPIIGTAQEHPQNNIQPKFTFTEIVMHFQNSYNFCLLLHFSVQYSFTSSATTKYISSKKVEKKSLFFIRCTKKKRKIKKDRQNYKKWKDFKYT